MFNKKLIIIFTLIALLSISSVSAFDDLSETNISASQLNEDPIGLEETNSLDESIDDYYDDSLDSSEIDKANDVSIDDEIIGDENSDSGSFKDLADELKDLSEGATVTLEKDYQFNQDVDDQLKEGIEVKSLTIDGQNHIIDAVNQSRIFNVTGNNVLLKNINFINSNSDYGGAIYFSGENLTIENCTFINNFADYGGAVYVENSAIFINSTFINNSAVYEGGAIHLANLTNITKCTFDGNLADVGASVFIKKPFVSPPPDEGDDTGPDEGGDDSFPDEGDDPFPDEGDDSFPDEGDDPFPDEDEFPPDEPDEDDDVELNTFIVDSIFKNSKDFSRGCIYLESAEFNTIAIEINGTVFEDMSAEYGPAIYAVEWVYTVFNKCVFNNLHANKTGGAAVFLSNSESSIMDCTFTNDSSSKNGGAIYCDANSWEYAAPMAFRIINSNFTNCSSDFGGAIVHLGSTLRIVNSSFTDNFATYDGGAVYSSDPYDVYLYDSNFTNNKLNFSYSDGLSSGGAFFVSFSELVSINNTNFINNSNQGVYVYQSRLRLNNSYFENNEEAVRLIQKIDVQFGDNNFTSDKLIDIDEDPFFVLINDGEGIQLDLINNTIDVDTLPPYYNSVDWGWVSPVKNQGFSGACWCFSTIAAIESSLLKSTGVLYDFSEQNIQKLLTQYSKYGNNKIVEPGSTHVAILYALSWLGPINEEEDSFDMIGKLTRVIPGKRIHIQDLIYIPSREVSYDLDYIKQAILKCGSITAEFYAVQEAPNFNIGTSAYYYNETDDTLPTHAVSIVGWDDNYSASNFINTPPGNGAWIIKNSYGTEQFDEGYCYISYYDKVIFKDSVAIGVLFENSENYNKNYQTGIGGEVEILNESSNYSYKNSYQAIDDDYISAIGTYFIVAGEEYSFEIYVNGNLKLTQYGKAPFYGYHTIKLDTQIPIKKGDDFTVVMKTHSIPILNKSNIKFKSNISFMDEGNGWEDLSCENVTAILRVYTLDSLRKENETRIDSQIVVKNMTVSAAEKGKGVLQIALKTIDGKVLSYKELDVFFKNQLIKIVTDVNGLAKLSFDLNKKGNFPVNIAYLGDSDHKGALASASIKVNPIKTALTASGKTYLATKKTKKFTAKLKLANGKVLAKKTVTFTVNGKTYKAKTNSKGIATIKLRLTKAKTYTVKIKFAGDDVYAAVSKSVKVKLKKEKTKLKAPKKTFKRSKKVKKVVVTLKNSKGKAIAKKKVTLTVNKKKYTAKTNKKGKATFKIKNLKKRGTKKYTVKFAGDSQYKACKKIGKIRIK